MWVKMSWTSLTPFVGPTHSLRLGLLRHFVLMSLTYTIVKSLYSLHSSFSFKKSSIVKYRLHMSSRRAKSILLWAFRLANDTVPLKSAFFLLATGWLSESKCFLARPKSTMKTRRFSRSSTKLEALTSRWMKPRLWTSLTEMTISMRI